MPTTATSQLIFFIAAIVVSSAVAGVFVGTVIKLSGDIKHKANDIDQTINTQIAIINDPSAMPYNSSANTTIIYVKNIGSTSLDPNATRVLIDGNYSASDNLTYRLLDNASAWTNEVTLEITIGNLTLSSGDHQAKVVVQYGRSAVLKFKI